MRFHRRFFWLVLAVSGFIFTSGIAQVFNSSNLPVILIDTHGAFIADDPKITADMKIISNGTGVRNTITDTGITYNYDGKIGIEFRGSSSQSFPKKAFGVELRDAAGNGIDASLLGMPKKDDWVLLAAYDDKSLIRDALAYRLAREQHEYASRSRFCELVVNGAYMGVYVLLEKVKRDKNRVNISKLDPASISGDALTGGYILKIDKTTGSGGDGWYSSYRTLASTKGQSPFFQYDYPKSEDIVPEQKAYIKSAMNTFENALAGDNFKDSLSGYQKYIDLTSFIDFFIINEATKNPDGYRLSSYFYKKKDSEGGKFYMGPVWDFNEGFGNVDYCTQGNPEGFAYKFNSSCPEDGFQIPFWWSRLLEDPSFSKKLSARWMFLRNNFFRTPTVLNYVDSVSSVLKLESEERNFQKWPILGTYVWPNYFVGNSYDEEITWMEQWIANRMTWLDQNIPLLVTDVHEAPQVFSIQAFPNPFSDEISFTYEIAVPGTVRIDLYDVMGNGIQGVIQSQESPGKYKLTFPVNAASGLYFYRALSGNSVVVEKLIKR
jgi:CotH kinase protein